jgi:hypothetical protein
MSAVFLLDGGETRLTLIAGPHVPDAWRRATSSFPLTPTRAGVCGTAVSRWEQFIIPDVVADPTFEPFREAARAAGIGAVWSTPFYAEDRRVLGTFAVISRAISTDILHVLASEFSSFRRGPRRRPSTERPPAEPVTAIMLLANAEMRPRANV